MKGRASAPAQRRPSKDWAALQAEAVALIRVHRLSYADASRDLFEIASVAGDFGISEEDAKASTIETIRRLFPGGPGSALAPDRAASKRSRSGADAGAPDERGGTPEQLDRLLADAAGASDERRPLISRSLQDLAENRPPPVQFAVDPLIVFRELLLLFGKPFGGKSLFALQLALHAAAALFFLNTFRFPRRLRTLYVDEEMGISLLDKRIEMMKRGAAEFRDPDVLRNVRVISREGLKLDNAGKLERLRREIGEFPGGPPDLVLMDTLRRLHDAEEKDSGEMAKVMEATIRIGQDFPSAPLAIHHSKKGPADEADDWREAARGSGDLVAASQSVATIWKTGDLTFSFRADVKAAGEIPPFPLLLDPETLLFRRQTEEERLVSKEAQKESAIEDARPRLLKSLGKLKRDGDLSYPPSWTTWRDKTDGNDNTKSSARDRLLAAGEIRAIKLGGKGGGFKYVFAEDAPYALGSGP